jgi:hypothetical protein
MNIEKLAKEHENDHPGYTLTDWYEAAFPSYEVYMRVLMQDEQPLPAIEQFVLQALETGLTEADEVCGVLGLEYEIVCHALERLHRLGLVLLVPVPSDDGPREKITITVKGRQILSTLVILRPEEEDFVVCLDSLTGEYYQHRRLRTAKSIREAGLHQIPCYLQAPAYDEIEVVSLKRIWHGVRRSQTEAERKKELLDVLSVEKAFTGYRPMRVLQFIRPTDGTVQVQVYDGSVRSARHETALIKMELEGLQVLRADRRTGPEQIDDPMSKVVEPQLYEAAKRKASEVPKLRREIKELERQIEQSEELEQTSAIEEDKTDAQKSVTKLRADIDRLNEQIEELKSAAPTIEVLSMIEHRPKLLDTLQDAQKRAIIISPWLTPTAVNRELLDLIASTLARGVEVWIGYGFSDPDYREKQALWALEKLQQRPGGQRLRLCRLADNHAKVLICDDRYMVTTSFNWLSFAGRQDWGNRHETGTLTTDPRAVGAMLDYWMPLLVESLDAPT